MSFLQSLCIFFLLSFPSYASQEDEYKKYPPLTSPMIEEGLVTWVNYTEGKVKNLAAKPQDVFMLKKIHMVKHSGRKIPLLVAHVLKDGVGFIHFFRWMTHTSDSENYWQIDQELYRTGFVDHFVDNYLGSIHYAVGQLGNDTFAETEAEGYFKLDLSSRPIYYCHLSDLVVKEAKDDVEIAEALISELCEFIFSTRSARVVISQVELANVDSRCVFAHNGFMRKELRLDPEQVNYTEYLLTSEGNYMITLNLGKLYFVPILPEKLYFNKYLSYRQWKERLKLAYPDTQDVSQQNPSHKDSPE